MGTRHEALVGVTHPDTVGMAAPRSALRHVVLWLVTDSVNWLHVAVADAGQHLTCAVSHLVSFATKGEL